MTTHLRDFTREHRGLLAINALLLLALLIVTFAPDARAQQTQRQRGSYTLVPARALGFTESAIWIVDASNQELVAMRYDRSTKQLRFLGFRDLALDAKQAQRRGR